MKRNTLPYIISLILLVILYIAYQYWIPRPLDWRLEFSEKSKKPYGLYLFYQSLPELFPESEIISTSSTFTRLNSENYNKPKTVFLFNSKTSFTNFTSQQLIKFVEKGNSVFYCSRNIDYYLIDSLGITQSNYYYSSLKNVRPYLHNHQFSPLDSVFYKSFESSYFVFEDSAKNIQNLGYIDATEPNFIRLDIGKGHFFLHTDPMPFTNYYLLKGNMKPYLERLMNELPDNDIVWMNSGKFSKNNIEKQNLLKQIGENVSLRNAYLFFLLLVLIFALTELWRTQRVIPIITRKENTSLTLVNSIARLFFIQNHNVNILHKIIRDFNYFVQSKYKINTQNADSDSMIRLQNKSGYPEEKMRELFRQIHYLKQQKIISNEQLKSIYSLIENFKKLKS